MGYGFEASHIHYYAKIVPGWTADYHDGRGPQYVSEKVIVYNQHYAERNLTIDEAKECVVAIRKNNKIQYCDEKRANELERKLQFNRTR